MIDFLKVYDIEIDEFCSEDGVTMMSIVKDPAVEKDFLAFNNQKSKNQTFKYSVNEEKRIITGIALRCDYPIYRKDGDEEYYVNMNAQVIEKIVCKFMRDMNTNNVNIEHTLGAQGIYLIESFILSDKHRLAYPEFDDVSNGSWVVSYKVDNPTVWKKIKQGELKGFSVELTADKIQKTKFRNKRCLMELYNLIKDYD